MRAAIRFVLPLIAALAAAASAQAIAPTPPMGWNSWDAYGFTIDEAEFKANATVLAALKPYGWTYAVIDEGWYMANPFGDKLATRKYQLDGSGRLIPDAVRFPDAAGGAGFKPLADWVHAQGLEFGLHIVRGIPKQAVEANSPIAGTSFHAGDAADTSDTCPWDDGNFGVRDNAAGQAYYDSVMALYAAWGVDFVKVDCIADHPYQPTEIRQVSDAIKKTGRPMILSLSPGPMQPAHAAEVARYAEMWRIGDDTWDGWTFPHNDPNSEWPNGLRNLFDKLALWHSYARPGAWPDADMLPFASLTPHPGWGDPRHSRLTQAEERTMFTLWAVARSPLILGANLTRLDAFTRSLITSRAVIAIDQTAWESFPVTDLPKGLENARVWVALTGPRAKPVYTLAVFDIGDTPLAVRATWKELGVPGRTHALRDLWTGERRVASRLLTVALPPHGSAIWRVE